MKATPATTHKKSSVEKEVKENSFPIVAIGASAGGLEAITELLKNLPSDTGMSFIYVQHLSPDHKSMLTEILSKHTKMKVQEIDDMDKIKPDNVFVIPHDKGIEVTDGHIKLIPRAENSSAISIDILFSSLAHAQKERVIGIILSGSGSDGTVGMKDIKQEGGLTFAEDDTAKFASMPQSAIAAGVVDFILSPKEIALELSRLSKHPFIKSNSNRKNLASMLEKGAKEDLIDNSNPDLKIILNHLHRATGVDFSQYKMTTIKRRIIRRMLLYKIETLKEYAKYLDKKNEEIDILYQDLLINVTSFFRDTDTHKYLKENLFPKLLKRKETGEPLRIWVPACASGEEAYSIAMMLIEVQDSIATKIPVQIFATDLSEQVIRTARIGLYSKQEVETVSPNRIQRFFTKVDGGYRVNKSVRDICVFAPHNILTDPPFSRLDFISCCNLFIYFDNAAQKKAVNTFHYALNDEGFLMLGKSETISQSAHLFMGVNKKYKIFSRKTNSGTRTLPQLSQRFANQTLAETNIFAGNNKTKRQFTHPTIQPLNNVDSAIDAVLLSEFMPASVAINHQMEIVQFRGATDLFLSHPKGKANLNILKMAKPEIAFELRNAIEKAIKTKKRVHKSPIEIKTNAAVQIISVEVVPLQIQSDEPLLLILFTEQKQVETFSPSNKKGIGNSIAAERRIKKLEEELAAAHADALAYSQELEAYIEELQSAGEEVVSSNEELQTVNEELETSKEEIESANEELIITNQELQTRNDLLNASYDYTEAVVATIHDSMIVLDKNLRIVSASKSFYKNFGVTDTETEGMLLYDLGNRQWNIPRLREFLEDILPKNSHFENFEVTHNFPHIGEKIMLLNASRITQKAKREPLILLSIQDVTDMRDKANELQANAQKEINESEYRFRNLVEKAFSPICIFKGEDMKLELANDPLFKVWQVDNKVIGKPLAEILPEVNNSPIMGWLLDVYHKDITLNLSEIPFEFIRNKEKKETLYFNFVYQPWRELDGTISGVMAMAADITEQVNARKKIEESEQRFQAAIKAVQGILWTNNARGEMEGEQAGWALLTGQTYEEYQGYGWTNAVHPDDVQPTIEAWNEAVKERKTFIFEHRLKTKDGQWRDFSIRAIPLLNADGTLLQWVGVHTDITDNKQAAKALKANEEKLNIVIEASGLGTYELNLKTKETTYSKRYLEILGGYKEDIQLTHAQLLQHLHPDDFLIREKAFNEAMDTGYLHYEVRLIWKDESIHWMEGKGKVFYDDKHNAEKLIGTIRDITEEKNHEQELKESEYKFRLLADSMPQHIWTSDTEGNLNYFNKSVFDYSGLTLEQINKDGWIQIVHPDDREENIKQWINSVTTGMDFLFEHRFLRYDGEYRWQLSRAIPQKDANDKIQMWVGTSTDIQEQKTFTQELEEKVIARTAELTKNNIELENKTMQLEEAQQLAHIGSWEWDVVANKIEWSDELFRIFGLTPQEFKVNYESYLTYIHPNDREYVNSIIQAALKDHQPYSLFHKVVSADGKVRVLSTTGKVTTDGIGNVIKMSGTMQDVTEQKNYEEELKISEERFYKIFDSNPVPMSLSEIKTSKIKYANNCFYDAFGYSKNEVIGHSSEELNLLDPEESKRVVDLIFGYLLENRPLAEVQALSKEEKEALLLKLKQSEKMKDFEILYTRKNGETFPAVVSYEVIRIGFDSYTVTSYQDITERKKAEALLRSQNDQLEKMNQELQSFAYISSHDLQEPLRKIQTFVTRIKEKEENNLSDAGKDMFNRMQNSAKRMQTLIQDLLAYSRTNTEERKFEKTDLNRIVEEVREDLKEELKDKHATIEATALGEANIIPFQFRQLLHNLIGNSLKFSSPNKPPHIQIKSEVVKGLKLNNEKLSPQKKYCHITVTDNGIGFEQQYSEKIFEVFQRLHGNNGYKGTGIGLSIVKKIVENHNGIITATSQLNEGARFDIYIPAT